MDHERFVQWLDQIYATTEAEIDCKRLQILLPAYVELEIAGSNPGAHLPQVSAHLVQCPDCAEECEGLRTVAGLEARGRLPQVKESLAQFKAEPAPEPA